MFTLTPGELLKTVGGRNSHVTILAERSPHANEQQIGSGRVVGRRSPAGSEFDMCFGVWRLVDCQDFHRIKRSSGRTVINIADRFIGTAKHSAILTPLASGGQYPARRHEEEAVPARPKGDSHNHYTRDYARP